MGGLKLLQAIRSRYSETAVVMLTACDEVALAVQAMQEGAPDYIVHIGRGAMLHDIGKIGISDGILLEPGKLSKEKWVEMRKHPPIGYWILRGIPSLKPAAEIVLAHHEHYDGSGYPRGLKGQIIPLGARIFSVVDCLDAMISNRPYQSATSYEIARNEIIRCSESQFDPEVVKSFLTVPAVE